METSSASSEIEPNKKPAWKFQFRVFYTNAENYALYGALFGLAFPVIATTIRCFEFGLNPIAIQKKDMLLWIINTAPFFLGLFAYFAGHRQDDIEAINRGLDQEIKRRTADLVKAKDAAEVASKAKGIFLANMSHEIRTPLNAILGFSQALSKSEGLAPKQRELVSAIGKAGNHLLALINNVLDLSKIEADRLELHETEFSLCDFLKDMSDVFSLSSGDKKFIWECSGFSSSELGMRVKGDLGKLRQVITNLVGNAQKFSRSEIRFFVTRSQNDTFLFEVIDNGVGIPTSAQKSIFEAFHQEKAGVKAGGTGLGLSICRRFVDLMGGDLNVDSVPNLGTRFFFEIPLAVVHRADPMLASAHRKTEAIAQSVPETQGDKSISQEPAAHAVQQDPPPLEFITPVPGIEIKKAPSASPPVKTAPDVPITASGDAASILMKIRAAAELYKVTDIKDLTTQLEALGGNNIELATKIRHSLGTYDMQGILKLTGITQTIPRVA